VLSCFVASISLLILLISTGLSINSTVMYSTSIALTVYTFLPL
jgi:hypothetical protein